jgi:2-oxoglutarate/2-oxoacid ferredoxin oxidoreductase subunit beta
MQLLTRSAPFRVDCSLNDYSSPRILNESCRYRYGYVELLSRGIQHKVFSFLDVFSPCVTYNHYNTFQWFRPRVKKLEDGAAYDPADWMAAIGKSLLWGEEIPIGKFFERTAVPSLHAAEPVLNGGPLVHADARIPLEVTRSVVEELM